MSPRSRTRSVTVRAAAGAALAMFAMAVATSFASAAPLRGAHRHASPNLALRLSASAGTVSTGQQVTYTATVVNTGRRADRNAGLRDLLPGKATLVSTTPSQGSCSGSQVIRCNLGSLARGASATVTIVATANRPGWMTDYAWVSTNPPGGWEHRHSVSTNVQGVSSERRIEPHRVARPRRHRPAGDVHRDRRQLGERNGRECRVPGSASGEGDPGLREREPGKLQRQPDRRVQPRVAERRRLRHSHDRRHGEPAGMDDRPRLGLEQPARELAASSRGLGLRPRRQLRT